MLLKQRRWAITLVIVMYFRLAEAIVHKHLTFNPPFMEMDHFGKRSVSAEWDAGGATKVMKHFVRLTPDQQSKTGNLWSVDAIGKPDFTSVLEFRISGKGERFFGDGLAFWMVEPEHHHSLLEHMGHYYTDDWGGGWDLRDLRADLPSGDFHGFVETFKGIGVIVDTYRNEEFYSSHKDVTVVVNTGNSTKAEILEASTGCNSQVRYYENRDDFDASMLSSRLKVELSERTLTVSMDPRNSQSWTDCTEIQLPDEMDAEWVTAAHIGVTASTGELSDNHDVIRLATYVSSDAAVKGEDNRRKKEPLEIQPDIPFLDRMTEMEKNMNEILRTIKRMEHDKEHEVAKVAEYVNELFDKTKANEKGLEESLRTLDEKVAQLEMDIKSHLEAALDSGLGAAAVAARGWRIPFVLLFAGVCVGAFACHRVYMNLRKTHLL